MAELLSAIALPLDRHPGLYLSHLAISHYLTLVFTTAGLFMCSQLALTSVNNCKATTSLYKIVAL